MHIKYRSWFPYIVLARQTWIEILNTHRKFDLFKAFASTQQGIYYDISKEMDKYTFIPPLVR